MDVKPLLLKLIVYPAEAFFPYIQENEQFAHFYLAQKLTTYILITLATSYQLC